MPFFVKRVLGLEPPTVASVLPHPLGAYVERIATQIPVLSLLARGRPLFCSILICSACDFVCPGFDLTDDQLLELYRDYRSASYNADRIRYEPSYRKIALQAGKSMEEFNSRMAHVEAFLADVPGLAAVRDALDYAGADGRLLPRSIQERCRCTVFEVSDEPAWRPEIRKVTELSQLGRFDYIQACHLLEHVWQPRVLLQSLTGYLTKTGLIYIEVPKEGSPSDINRLRAGAGSFPIHEHINIFTEKSLSKLIEGVGLNIVKLTCSEVDFHWARATVLSAIATC
jgi:hypothetical protein